MSSSPGAPVDNGPFAQFRRDHARVLAEIDVLEGGVLLGATVEDDAALRRAFELLALQFATHMAAEESVLYPAIGAAFPPNRLALEALGNEHVELRLMLTTLSRALDAPPYPGRDEQFQVVLRDFVDLLRLHIHREESAVFDVTSRVLSNPEAAELARRIAPLVDPNPPGDREPGPTKGIQS